MRNWQVLVASVFLFAAMFVPLLVPTDYILQILFRVFLFAALGLAWNLVGGYAGQLSLGHAAYFGVGAYGLALFSKLGISPWVSVFLGVALAVICAGMIGTISFRLRGPYFALCTIAFAEVLRLVAKNLPNVTGGDVGAQVPALFTNSAIRSFYWAAVLLTAFAFALTAWIERSRFGYYLMAIREDQDTALSVGVNAARCKLWSLLISAAITGFGGALYASIFLFIVPDQVLGDGYINRNRNCRHAGRRGYAARSVAWLCHFGELRRNFQNGVQRSASSYLWRVDRYCRAVHARRRSGDREQQIGALQESSAGALRRACAGGCARRVEPSAQRIGTVDKCHCLKSSTSANDLVA